MSKEIVNDKYAALLERLKSMSAADLVTDKFDDFWEDLILLFGKLSDKERKELTSKLREIFELEEIKYGN